MASRLVNLIFCILIVLSAQEISGQKKSRFFQIPGRVKMDKGDPGGTVVNLINLQSNISEKTINVSSGGKFDLQLNYQTEYKLSLAKDGYYTKEILISTVVPSNVWQKDSVFPPYYIVVTLFKKVPDTTLSFEGKTIGRISYSPKGGLDNFDSENYLNDKDIKDEIEMALKNSRDGNFNEVLAAASDFEKAKDLRSAYQKYLEANKLKPNDKFVKEKINDLTNDLKNELDEAKLLAEFNRLMELGTANVEKKSYQIAVTNFKDALKIKPGELTASAKLREAEQLLAEANAEKVKAEEEFKRLLAQGDENVNKKLYPDAIDSYNSALKVKPENTVVKAKLASAEKLLAQAKADKAKLEENFTRLLASGDKNVSEQKYPAAIADYKGALSLKPDDAVAKQKLASAEGLLAALNAEKVKAEEEFNRLLTLGDENITKKMYPEAIASYSGALKIKPEDTVCKTKLASAEKLLAQTKADKAKLEENFTRLLANGDKNVGEQKYPAAIIDYKGALSLKPDDATAKQKLTSAEGLLAALNAEKAKAEEEFNRLLALGDENVTKQLYQEAIASYAGALKIKPEDSVGKAKLASAEKLLAQANADKAKLEENFTRLLASGDKNVSEQKYPAAIVDYKGALSLRPDDATAKQKLTSAEGLLAALNAEKAKAEEEFNRLLTLGDENITKRMYPEAIASYSGALKIKPEDTVCKTKLASAEKLLAQANADKAKLEENFSRLLASGDKNVGEQKYPAAIVDYKGALSLKPDDATAKQKLTSAEGLLAALNAEKAKAEEEFNRLLALGDENVTKQLYQEAIASYAGALKIKPEDSVGKAKLASAEKLLAQAKADKAKLEENFTRLLASGDKNVSEQKYPDAIADYKGALSLKPDDAVAKQKLTSAEGLLAALNAEKAKADEEFNRLLALGDENVAKKLYQEAIAGYNGALKIKPGNPVCSAKLASAEKLLAQANADKAKLEENFKRLLASGEKNVSEQKYPAAIADYKGALSLKPDDAVAKQKFASAEGLLAALNAEKAKAEEEFNRLLALGDENAATQRYQEAIANYNGALKIKPDDSKAIDKLKTVEEYLAKEKETIASKILESQKKDNSFQDNINKGDENYKKSQWANARFYYVQALNIKPEDKYTISKVESCDKMIEANITAEKLKEYENLISKGNDAFKNENYTSARFYYRSSIALLPWETFPQLKLREIDQILNEKLTMQEKQMLKENQQKADEAFNKKEYSIARFYYNKVNEISQDEYSLSRLKEIENIVNGYEEKRINSEYTSFIRKANEAVQQKNISLARYYYQKAVNLKPDEAFSKEELKKLNRYN